MTDTEIITIIAHYSLTIRCLPYEVISYWTYKEGDDEYSRTPVHCKREVIIKEGKKFLKEIRTVANGGWFYVKQTANTDSTVRFDREHDKFFAPTLAEAIQLFLKSRIS